VTPEQIEAIVQRASGASVQVEQDTLALVAEITRLAELLTATSVLVPCECRMPNGEHADWCSLGLTLRQIRDSETH
jgi:hypothetical protein